MADLVNGDLKTLSLSSKTFDCDNKFNSCKQNDIRSVTVVSDTETEISFQLPPGFDPSGEDVLTLHENIECEPGSYQCNAEKLAQLKGEFDLCCNKVKRLSW